MEDWNGEGLPPVGAVCLAKHLDGGEQREATVIHYYEGWVWLRLDTVINFNVVWVACDVEFSVLKTEEEQEIEEMARHIKAHQWTPQEIARDLYAAGYRKQ